MELKMEDEMFYEDIYDNLQSDKSEIKIQALKEVKDKYADVKRMTF
jgi:hypothetical protein